MQLKRNKEMEFETLKKSHKKQIIIGALAICVIGGALTFNLTRAKYKITESIPLVKGIINYQVPDMRVVAVNVSEDGTNYNVADEIPVGEYTLNTDKTICKVATETSGIENAPKDDNITFEYVDNKINIRGVSKRNTRCYLYFDKVLDTEKPVITNVTTSATKTEINVTVTATDNEGVTEYWYQLNSNTPVKGTGNTYQFTGLTAGTTYSVKVYVKDAAGNQSDTTTKSVTTTPNGITPSNIIANATKGSGTPTFSKTACKSGCEETTVGTYTVSDPVYGGTTTYWRGDVTDNYVKFANFCWRIVRINGDGSIRLIYDGTTCHANGTSDANSIAKTSIAYNTSYNNSSYVGWTYTASSQRPSGSGTASNAKSQLESWYSSNITGTNASKVADGKYCNDRNVQSGNTWSATGSTFYYAANKRIYTDHSPSLACNTSDVYTLKVGLITVDEAMYAGGRDANNTSYYLYNGQNYWTMSPRYWDSPWAYVFLVNTNGYLGSNGVDSTSRGLRPVINLKADTLFVIGGNGTQNNPYIVQ